MSTRKKSSNRLASDKEEIRSVQGILINRKYSNMRFATKDLLPLIVEQDLSDLFSMEFYGTREKEKDDEQDLIKDMMGRQGNMDDNRSSLLHSKQKKYFYAGRPDWNRIFLRAIARAHCTSEEGESVGVFFCGSPAIAKDLQAEAKVVTAHHQFAMKHLEGKVCKCKLIVHCESF
jgi:respiratory burst oxidase